jgi:hypothetical protein
MSRPVITEEPIGNPPASSCCSCKKYVDCKTRTTRMRKIKSNHPGNTREEIRVRIAMMDKIAADCEEWTP